MKILMRKKLVFYLVLLATSITAAFLFLRPEPRVEISSSLIAPTDTPLDSSGFARVTEPGISFPSAYGPHPEYQSEWWYYTGNLQTAEGRRFGYQFTIFRRSILPDAPHRASNFAAQSVYMAHFTVTDAETGNFYPSERFQRGAAGLAGAEANPYQVWLDDWSIVEIERNRYRMRAASDEVAIELTLHSLKPPALHGQHGLSQKGIEEGNASYYYSQTRLETTGTVTVGEERFAVSGLSWKDHEFGTSSLGENAVGWDWVSLQLSDNRELMYFQIRTKGGGVEPTSSGSLILEDGNVRPLQRSDVELEILDHWTSPESDITYPARWRLRIPSEQIELTIEPLIPNQELNVSTVYWEGAVVAEGTAGQQPVSGRGYFELTGYGDAKGPSV